MPTDPILSARGRVAYASRKDKSDPNALIDARRALATAKLDKAIREYTAEADRLTDAQVAHLCGLLMAEGGVKYDAVTVIEPMIRAAVLNAQTGAER